MINIAEVNKCKELSKTNEIYFIFKFIDVLYYWKSNDYLEQKIDIMILINYQNLN